jgi:hypothetical protein
METNPPKYSSAVILVKKYFPYAFLFLLTLFLMILFRHNKKELGQFLEKGRDNLVAFYSQNLKPLLFKTQISEEDIFNFALYRSLPIDKEKKKILVLNNETSGSEIYEIRSAEFNSSTHNYDSFKKYLKLDAAQNEQAESILNSYKKEIYSSVFMNDKNTFAVNPKINKLQQAILADLISFSQSIDKNKTVEIFHKSFTWNEDKNVANLISAAKQGGNGDFILITPDTVTKTRFEWDQERFNDQLEELERNKDLAIRDSKEFNLKLDIEPIMEEVARSLPKELNYTVNPDMYKVVVPIKPEQLSKMVKDSLGIKLNEVVSKLRMVATEMKKQSSKNKFRMNIPIPAIPNVGDNPIPPIMIDPSEMVGNILEGVSKMDFSELAKYGVQMDSLSKYGGKGMNDSVKKKIFDEISKMKKEFKKKKVSAKTSTSNEN